MTSNNVVTEEELYNLIKPKIDNNTFSDIEKIAYMIMVIARERSFKSSYYWNNKIDRELLAQKVLDNENKNDVNEKQLICITAARLLKNIASKFDIDIYYLGAISGIISKNSFDGFLNYEHVIPIYEISDNKYVSVDLERNLDNIQTNKRWFNFGRKYKWDFLVSLDQNQIDEIMQKIGYIETKNDYLDVYIDKIINHENSNLENLIEILGDQKISRCASKLQSSVDIYRFYKKIIVQFFNSSYNDVIFSFGGKTNYDKNTKYITGIYYDGYEENFWLWSNIEGKMIKISRENFEKFTYNYKIELFSGKDNVNADDIIIINKNSNFDDIKGYKRYLLN